MADPVQGPPGTWQRLCWWREDGTLDLRVTADRMPADDVYASHELTAERPGQLHHSPGAPGTWYIWDGRCHRPDTSEASVRIVAGWALRFEQALAACRSAVTAQNAAQGITGQQAQQAWAPFATAQKYAAGLRKSAGLSSLLRYLGGLAGVSEEDMAERNPDCLNFANGTLDLRTGLLKPHDPADMITYCLDVPYDPQSPCPRFLDLLYRAAGRDPQVAAFVSRLLGYSVLGWNPEQVIAFLAGPTASGKSKLLEIVSAVTGPLARESQAALICLSKHGRNARVENSIRGARLVTITETSAFMHIEEAQVKRLTGESWIAVDQHYQKTALRTPVTWLIVLATNQMPSLVNFDDALRRRMLVVPMGETIPYELRNPKIAQEIAAEEATGIAAWLAREAMAWYQRGLEVPAVVSAFTDKYAAEQDTVAQFAAERCLLNGHLGAYNVPVSIGQGDAWTAYQDFSRGQHRLGRNEFYEALSRLPGVTRNEPQRRFEGITWKSQGPLG